MARARRIWLKMKLGIGARFDMCETWRDKMGFVRRDLGVNGRGGSERQRNLAWVNKKDQTHSSCLMTWRSRPACHGNRFGNWRLPHFVTSPRFRV